jgi:hypothetical protein
MMIGKQLGHPRNLVACLFFWVGMLVDLAYRKPSLAVMSLTAGCLVELDIGLLQRSFFFIHQNAGHVCQIRVLVSKARLQKQDIRQTVHPSLLMC